MTDENKVFIGIIASSKANSFLTITSGYIEVVHGKITKIGTNDEFLTRIKLGCFSGYEIVELGLNQFLMPGLVDCHTHAPQFPNIGVGLDRPLLEWLDKYTFPLESQYSDVGFATRVYNNVVRRLLINGTTTACYFGSIHLDGTMELVRSVIRYGQRALVGKVSMNIENNAGYYNETAKELTDIEDFVQQVLACKNDLVLPIVTPRFALSCDEELMSGLSKIADKYNCRIQSHMSENPEEIDQVLKLYPTCSSYGDVYDKSNILNNRCIMAHVVHPSDAEIALLVATGVSVAHCPSSNTRLKSGLCPVRKLLEHNVTVGLGTDVAGGDSASVLDAMRRAMDVSTHLHLAEPAYKPIDWREAFYLATLGGAKALKLGDKVGSFEVGKEFDALLVDVFAEDGPLDQSGYSAHSTRAGAATDLVQRFIYSGDDRNILQVYVSGGQVKDF